MWASVSGELAGKRHKETFWGDRSSIPLRGWCYHSVYICQNMSSCIFKIYVFYGGGQTQLKAL